MVEEKTQYQIESKQPYFQKVEELLNKYEDGWNLFIKAHEEQDFDLPIQLKPEFENDPYIPHTWLGLADRVISIIAKEKYKLDTNPNRIEIVRSDQMLDAYVRPIPEGPTHWSYGKSRMKEEQQYGQRAHLAYEIIINAYPALAYCMDTNSPVMQMLVFAHASYGHNAFYKNNYLFAELSEPNTIMAVNERLRDLVDECEEKYGIEEVEQVLDFCHAMRFMDTTFRPPVKHLTTAEKKEKAKKIRERKFLVPPEKTIFDEFKKTSSNSSNDNEESNFPHPEKGRRNILRFVADRAGQLPEWKRDIMRLSSDISQHFLANMNTNVANEGTACITHYQIMTTLRDIGLINFEMFMEFRRSHDGVVYQPPGTRMVKNPYTEEMEEQFIGSPINIYSLGFAIFEDIKRICEDKNPSEEDLRWFPHLAGKGNWVEVCNNMIRTCNNETLVQQYLSPTVIRKFKYFMLEGNPVDDEYLTVSAIHADDGFKKIRDQLAKDYRVFDQIPKISLKDYQEETDRCLVLQHHIINDQRLNRKTAEQITELIHAQTKHPVVIESVNENGTVLEKFSSPEDYDYLPHKRQSIHFQLN